MCYIPSNQVLFTTHISKRRHTARVLSWHPTKWMTFQGFFCANAIRSTWFLKHVRHKAHKRIKLKRIKLCRLSGHKPCGYNNITKVLPSVFVCNSLRFLGKLTINTVLSSIYTTQRHWQSGTMNQGGRPNRELPQQMTPFHFSLLFTLCPGRVSEWAWLVLGSPSPIVGPVEIGLTEDCGRS